ncbi:methylated-DNA--[protein]-cysteine S-methyltransferase [Anaerolineales bacterium]
MVGNQAETVHIGHVYWEPVGAILVASSEAGVVAIHMGGVEVEAFATAVEARHFSFLFNDAGYNTRLASQMREYFAHQRKAFDVPVDYRGLSDFQRLVYEATLAIPYGKLATYGDVAQSIGKEKGSRAVGQALAHNPIPILIPCHRVLNHKMQLHGYSGAGGLNTKRELLKHEGAILL